jgi:CBS domain containing-hemolysin-like protein
VVHLDGFRITVIEMEGRRVGRALVSVTGPAINESAR